MDLVIKIGNKRPQIDPAWQYDYRDGHIVNERPDKFYDGYEQILKHFAVIRLPLDYFQAVGSSDSLKYSSNVFKQAYSNFLTLKKYTSSMHLGKYPWEVGYVEPKKFI